MSPETGNIEGQTRQEAIRITNMLLADEEQVAISVSKIRAEHGKTIRARLGYEEIEPADISDLKDVRIEDKSLAITPEALADTLYVTEESAQTTRQARQSVEKIYRGREDKLAVFVGPCSVLEEEEIKEYAGQVKEWREEFGDHLEIVMRFHAEKPRTKGKEEDWKGLAVDPQLDGSSNVNLGLVATRLVMCQITSSGVPLVSERLDNRMPQYTNGLVTNDTLGARNALDSNGRAYMSGTSATGIIKNPPDGNIQGAIDGVISASEKHVFLGTNMGGSMMVVKTLGNQAVVVAHRGGKDSPNYSAKDINETVRMLDQAGLRRALVVDAAHDNSYNPATGKKEYIRQIEAVIPNLAEQIASGQEAIKGVMIESSLKEGSQELIVGTTDPTTLERGVSVTDPCINLVHTERALQALRGGVHSRRLMRK